MKKYLTILVLAASSLAHAGDPTADEIINYLEHRRVQNYRERQLGRHLAPNDPAWAWITTEPQPRQSTAQDLEAMARMLGVIE